MRVVQVLLGDKLFNVVYRDRFVYVASGTCRFAIARTHAAAHGGKGIFEFNQFQRFFVFALRCKFYIALNADVSRAFGFARARTAVRGNLGVCAVIGVPVGRAPFAVARRRRFFRFNRMNGAQFLSDLKRVYGTMLDAFAAGNALVFIHVRHIVRAHHIVIVKHSRRTQRKARTAAAVTDSVGFARPVCIRDLVHQAVVFGAADNVEGFFARDLAAASRAYVIFRGVPHLNAHIFF